MQQTKRTKIVCTMGPSTEDEDVLRELIKSGMNVARFNFSHGSHEYHKAGMARVRKVADELGATVAILLDTKGPEVRTGLLKDGKPVTLVTDQQVTVTTDDDVIGTDKRFSLDYKNLPNEVTKGSLILIDDGLIGLEVQSVSGTDMLCTVTNGGELGEKKGVNVPNVNIGLPAITEQDIDDITFGCEQGIDAIAASFIRDAAGVNEIRQLCADHGCPRVSVYPKIECAQGVTNFDEILEAASGIMVARGDLGVEVPAAKVPHLQKQMIRKCNEAYKPVITATQMLDSMIRNPRPTRAEVTDVANAIYDGTDCVMLSGETAAGKYPVEAVKTMASICVESEKYLNEGKEYYDRGGQIRNVNGAIGFAAVTTAERVDAKCILAPTTTGRTARLISDFRPDIPVVAVSESAITVRKCCFYWGVQCLQADTRGTLSDTIYGSLKLAKEAGLADSGDMVVVTAGDPQTSPKQGDYVTSTNMVMVAQVQ
jgi:pyruvate kinase